MNKIIWVVKLLPILTILHGLFGSGSRMGSLVDTLKVALTQYELSNITKLYVEEAGDFGKDSLNPQRFVSFVNDNYHNQYSIFARDFVGAENTELSFDIWGTPFQIEHVVKKSKLKIFSAGPDKTLRSKDDVVIDIALELAPESAPPMGSTPVQNPPVESLPQAQVEAERVPAEEMTTDETNPSDMESNLNDGRENPYVQDQPQDEIIDYESDETSN